MIDWKALDDYIQQLGSPDERGIQFQMLSAYAYRCHEAGPFTLEEQAAFVAAIQERIAHWPVEMRKAKDEWWMDLRWEDTVYEYGYNNGGGAPTFYGFWAEPDWLMPLARSAKLSNPTITFAGAHLQSFLQSPAIAHLQILRIDRGLGPELVAGMMESGRFGHLRVLETPYLHGLDKVQMKVFAKWKQANGMASKKV